MSPNPCWLSLEQDGRLIFDWLAHLKNGSVTRFHVPLALRFRGRLNVGALEAAINRIVRRHDVLRSIFPDVAQLPPEIGRQLAAKLSARRRVPEPLFTSRRDDGAHIELRRVGDQTWGVDGHRLCGELCLDELDGALDRSVAPLLRASLRDHGASDHLLLVAFDHLICDGWSLEIFRRELVDGYRQMTGAASSVEALPEQYSAFARRQRQWLMTPEADTAINDARDVLAEWEDDQIRVGELEPLECDAPADAATVLPHSLVQAAREFCIGAHVTAYVFYLAALSVAFRSIYRRRRTAVWVRIAGGRDAAAASLFGWCAGEVLIGIETSDDMTLWDLVQQARGTIAAATSRPHVPRFVLERLRFLSAETDRSDRIEIALQVSEPKTIASRDVNAELTVQRLLIPRTMPRDAGIQVAVERTDQSTIVRCILPARLRRLFLASELADAVSRAAQQIVTAPSSTLAGAARAVAVRSAPHVAPRCWLSAAVEAGSSRAS
jgi:hypothetical protein